MQSTFTSARLTLLGMAFAFAWLISATMLPDRAEAQYSPAWTSEGPSYLSASQRRRRAARRRARQRRARQRRARQRNAGLRRSNRRSKKKPTPRLSLPAKPTENAPVQIVISLGQQRMTVYQAGKAVGRSRVSTGKRGYTTPQGIFSIIHKRRRHYSNIYNGAPMPFMQRLTWSGIALHMGVVPNYPASHGCIRLPGGFARALFGFSRRRSHVVVAQGNPVPQDIQHDVLFKPRQWPAGSPPSQKAPSAIGQSKSAHATAAKSTEQSIATNAVVTGSVNVTPKRREIAFGMDDLELQVHRRLIRATRSAAPLRMLIARRSQRERTRDAQSLLTTLGYDVGPADGYIGKQTVAAIKAFQQGVGRVVTGYPNEPFYKDLYRAVGKAGEHDAFLYVRQNQKDIYAVPITLNDPDKPLGTHLYTVIALDEATGTASWSGITVKSRGRVGGRLRRKSADAGDTVQPVTMRQALDRISIPDHVRLKIEDMLTAGSSLIVADGGHDRETGRDTDFIVVTD